MYKVVICDDERIIREGLKNSIDWSEFKITEVILAKDGVEGLSLINMYNPLVAIIDIRMPRMDGIELLNKIDGHSCKKIILSSYDDYEYMKAGIKHNVSDYLLKPVNHEELREVLKTIIVQNKEVIVENNLPIFSPLKQVEFDDYYVNKIIKCIRENYQNKQSVKEILKKFDSSDSYLMRVFKQEVGITILDYLNRYRIYKSLNLLDNKYKYYEVAEMVGFSEYKVFNYQFKKYIEVSPSDYNKNKVLKDS